MPKGNLKLSCFQSGKKIGEDEMYDMTEYCPICLNQAKRKPILIVQERPRVDLLYCNYCKGASVSHMPKKKTLDEYYSGYYHDNNQMVTFHDVDRFASHILKYINIDLFVGNIRILDFGGGDGSLAKSVAKKISKKNSDLKIDITLVDFKREGLMDFEDPNISFKAIENLDTLNDKYDIVIASGVLEHIPEPNRIIRKLFSLINKKGFFYARTPFMSPFKRLLRNIDFIYPAHVHDLGASFWNVFVETFNINARAITSKPAIVETQFSKAFLNTLCAYLLKLPAYIELVFGRKKEMWWNFYGGWEVFLQMN